MQPEAINGSRTENVAPSRPMKSVRILLKISLACRAGYYSNTRNEGFLVTNPSGD
jgi:hypothetical protein